MSKILQISILRDDASEALAAFTSNIINRRALHAELGGHAESILQNYFSVRDREPNRRGWPSAHFWEQIRSATSLTRVDDEGAEITIADARMNQKVYGGTIKPKESKYLALPAIAEAYDRSPRSLNNLHPIIRFINGERRAIALAENLASEIKYGRLRKDGTRSVTQTASRIGTIWYWLVESVTQLKDERALPDEDGFQAGLRQKTGEFYERFGVR